MGSTPRDRVTQIPLPTRSSEISSECFGRIILSYLNEGEQASASFFDLGEILHMVIETSILLDYIPGQAMEQGAQQIELILDSLGDRYIESTQRGYDTILADFDRMIRNWFDFVHPDSPKRLPIYNEYDWPPKVEVNFFRSPASSGTRYGVWGTVDTLFTRGEHSMIVDWKSGVKRPQSDFQLQFYRFGLMLPEAAAHFHMLDRVRPSSVIVEAEPFPGEDAIRWEVSLAERRKDAILKGYMPRFQPDWYCNYCPVQHLCPVDGDPRDRNKNEKRLKRLLRKAEAMPVIPR